MTEAAPTSAETSSPFRPEPPSRHRLVDLAMAVAGRHAGPSLQSPHLHGGCSESKLLYEYEGPDEFWAAVATHASLADLRGRDVLDVGCGWGGKAIRYAEDAAPRSIVGIDLAQSYNPCVPQEFAAARGLSNCRFVAGEAERMPFKNSFDIAIMDDVLEHVGDPASVLRECARVLRPGGLLIVKFPSIRMIRAHHLDRAISFPGLHYMLSLRTWAAGLNDYKRRHPDRARYEPFDAATRSRFGGRWVTQNLNGLDLAAFVGLVENSPFEVLRLGIHVSPSTRFGFGHRLPRRVYRRLSSWRPLAELLGSSIVFVGQRQGPA